MVGCVYIPAIVAHATRFLDFTPMARQVRIALRTGASIVSSFFMFLHASPIGRHIAKGKVTVRFCAVPAPVN